MVKLGKIGALFVDNSEADMLICLFLVERDRLQVSGRGVMLRGWEEARLNEYRGADWIRLYMNGR